MHTNDTNMLWLKRALICVICVLILAPLDIFKYFIRKIMNFSTALSLRILLILLLSNGVNEICISQNLTVGIKGSFISTWLFNKYVSDAPAGEQDYFPSFGDSYGLSAAIFFNKKIGVEMNFFYASHRQQYEGRNPASNDIEYKSETSYNKIDIPILFKFNSASGGYLEIGPQYSIITKPTYYYIESDGTGWTGEIDSLFAKTAINGLIGVGVDIEIVAGLALTTALRFDVSITDLKGVDAFGEYISNYSKYHPTHSAAAGFLIGLTYRIGKKSSTD